MSGALRLLAAAVIAAAPALAPTLAAAQVQSGSGVLDSMGRRGHVRPQPGVPSATSQGAVAFGAGPDQAAPGNDSRIVDALPATGGTLTGTHYLRVPGAPSVQSLQKSVGSVAALLGWGFIGDGNSHPLSGVTSFNGLNTTKWTLAQWKAVLPAATALSNQMDWASLQSYINSFTGPGSVTFPANSHPLLDRPISVCNQSVAFYGSGNGTDAGNPASTHLEFTSGTDGFTHCLTSSSKIEAHNLQISSDVIDGSNAGIRDRRANYTILDNVAINGFNGYCGYFVNPAATRLQSVRCFDAQASGTSAIGVGLYFTGQSSFVNHINDTLVQGYETAYWWHSTNALPTVGIEDTQVINSACGGVRRCILIDSASPYYGPFNYSFINMSVDATSQFIAAPNCNDVVVYGGNWLVDPPVGRWTGGFNLIDLGTSATGCNMTRLRDMWVGNATTATANSLVTVENDASDVQISGMHVETNNLTMSGGWFQLAPNAVNVRERDTVWVKAFAPIAPPVNAVNYNGNASPTNRMESVVLGTPRLGADCGSGATLTTGSTNADGVIIEGSGNPTQCTVSYAPPYRALQPAVELFNQTAGGGALSLTLDTPHSFQVTHAAGTNVIHYHATPY